MALPFLQKPQLQAVAGGLDSPDIIRERLKDHTNEQWREIVYRLRLLVADQLDITLGTTSDKPIRKENKFGDIIKANWEEGRHNPVRVNTHLQVKSLVFNEPDLKWSNCVGVEGEDQPLISEVRKAFYLQELWRKFRFQDIYRNKLLDMIVAGEGNVAYWELPTGLTVEYIDLLDITWDPAYKDGRRRWVMVDRSLPKSEALQMFPQLKGKLGYDGGNGGEQSCTITLYFSNTTYGVLYKNEVLSVQPNKYKRIPVRCTELFRELSVKHPTGMVELQVGSLVEQLRHQRSLREIALKCVPVPLFKGDWDPDEIAKVTNAEEGEALVAKSPSSTFEWIEAAHGGITQAQLERISMLDQQMTAESGVNDFQRGQTDTEVDFASQLALIARQGGAIGKYTEQQHEDGIREDARMFLEIAQHCYQPPREGLTLVVGDHAMTFDLLTPINLLLGSDGDIQVQPGGMTFKSSGQKLQEDTILAQALGLWTQLPPGIMERGMLKTLKSAGQDDAEEWIQSMMEQQMIAQQQAMAMAQMQAATQPPQGQGAPASRASKQPAQAGNPGPQVQAPGLGA